MVWAKTLAASCFVASGLWAQPAWAQFVIDDSFPAEFSSPFEAVHRLASAELLDPRSAQYKGFVQAQEIDPDLIVLCAWMNWKDETGAYGPFLPMVYLTRPSGAPLGNGAVEATFVSPPSITAGGSRKNPVPSTYGCPAEF